MKTILAEKYETVLRRGLTNTRARDFYDLYVLFHLYHDEINEALLKRAIEHTAKTRGSLGILPQYREICEDILGEPALERLWNNYAAEFEYAAHLSFDEIVQNVIRFGDYLGALTVN